MSDEAKISPTVTSECERLADARTAELSILVTVREGTEARTLEAAGMRDVTLMSVAPIASGRCSPQVVASLAALPDVVRIELDGEVHAL